MADPLPKYAKVNPNSPEAWAVCDRCGFYRNTSDLVWQVEWAGQHLYNIRILVCRDRCYDTPNPQLRTVILPPDPLPVLNARVPNFAYEEQTVRIIQFADPTISSAELPWGEGPQLIRCEQSGEVPRVLQYLTSS
jgi:hypothetical protein